MYYLPKNLFHSFLLAFYAVTTPASADTVVEFYNSNLDHYFITADANEAAQIDNGSAGPGWSRTGYTFASGGSDYVCRFYGSQSPGPNSHFYTVDADECAWLKQFQASTPASAKHWNFESMGFVSTPPVNGVCSGGTTPVYRAYNNGWSRGIDSNHRITGSLVAIQEVEARGWRYEGVVMCAPATGYPVVDTGQIRFYGNSTELSAAPTSESDTFYGQDARFVGLQPAYTDNGDGTVTDLNTGLMWVKARGGKVSWADAKTGATNSAVGGYTDWRMPTIKESYSLIEFNGNLGFTHESSVLYIDTKFFDMAFGDANPDMPNTTVGNRLIDGQDWSSSRYVSTTMNGDETVFGVNFIDGRIKGYPVYDPATGAAHTMYVRYVRGNPEYGANHFVSNGDGTVTDNATGLMWAQNDSGATMNWQDTLAWVQQQNSAVYLGHQDWRLPNVKELQSIVDYTRSPDTTASAAIDPLLYSSAIVNEGGQTDYPFYWAGTTHVEHDTSNQATYISFGRALGWMKQPGANCFTLYDVHGAGAQRSDPKNGSVTSYPLGSDCTGHAVYGRGPQGDVVRITNHARLVRDAK